MRRARQLRLVLVGGGILLAASACDDQKARCEAARAENAKDADRICAGEDASGSGGSGASAYHASGSSSHWSGSERGGFGASAAHFSSGG
ncbi:hypothetical protein LPC08_06650 [Roseomonas sp. OT10]|uniref:hypothetical protein n=1 Tax=Roseomonas cutis TaxID=2897332 RepID=UPI001E2B76D2|nr:hypothetical protein [Roseomonas sp. OT10]UFN50299.1 hypothetical protein LPC08_06650 [Roseomonas sp. OT10]